MSKEFPIVQHFGSVREIPQMLGMINSPSTTSMTSEMSDSVMMESTIFQMAGQLVCHFCSCNTNWKRILFICCQNALWQLQTVQFVMNFTTVFCCKCCVMFAVCRVAAIFRLVKCKTYCQGHSYDYKTHVRHATKLPLWLGKFLDRNHLYSLPISRSVTELWSTRVPMNFCYTVYHSETDRNHFFWFRP